MGLRNVKRQKSKQLELPWGNRGEAPKATRSVETWTAAHGNERSRIDRLMEWVVEERNVQAAVRRVKRNKGSPGIDGMDVKEWPQYLGEN